MSEVQDFTSDIIFLETNCVSSDFRLIYRILRQMMNFAEQNGRLTRCLWKASLPQIQTFVETSQTPKMLYESPLKTSGEKNYLLRICGCNANRKVYKDWISRLE